MPINVQIPDTELDAFSQEAKECVQKEVARYAKILIKESKQVDERNRAKVGLESGTPDVTLTIVTQAIVEIRPTTVATSKAWLKTIRISAAIFSFIVGLIYDSATQQGGFYQLFMLLLFCLAAFFTILSMIKE